MSLVLYWDTSAVLSALLQDGHTLKARAWLEPTNVHLMSSLTGAEFHACVARLGRDGHLTPAQEETLLATLEKGPWRRVALTPDWKYFRQGASKDRLRGADLWHLALASTLCRELPTLKLLTYDQGLQNAALRVGLGLS